MLPDCLIEFVPSSLPTTSHPRPFSGVGSYALQALGGHHASTERSVEDAAERPTENEGNEIESAIAVVNGDHVLRDGGRPIA
jgi:hypothetical protein